MIHTLKSEHFYKSDVLAMLNTLFPPGVRELPNDRINPKVLHKHRSTFYRYIMAVEANGPKIMDSFEERLLRPGTRHGWQETRQNLEAYLDLADRMMDQTEEAFGIAFFRKSQSSRTDSWTPSSSSERPMTGSSRNTSFDDQTPMESPRVAGPLHDKSSIKSRIRNLPKISTANGTQNYVDRTQASVPSTASLDSSPNSWSNMPQNPRPKTPLVDPNPTQVRPHALSRPTTPFFEPNSEATRSETFWRPVNPLADPRAILQTHRRTISSINRPATSLDFRGPFNGTLDMTIRQSDSPSIPLISPNTALPSDNLEFLQRPYESSTHPVLKKKTSFGNLFLRRKASAASSAFQDNFDEIDALGIKPTSAKPMETFPRFSTDEQLGERPKLKKQFSLGFLEDEMRPWSRASRRSDAEPSPKPKTKAKMTFVSMFTKNSTQGELEPDFIETADKHFTLANHSSILQKARSYGSSISPTDSERTLTPGSTSGRTTPRKTALKPPLKSPRKTPRLFRKRSTEVIITSADIKEPFPLALQKQVLTPRIDKDPNKARAEQYSRDWFLADAHAKNFDWNKPAGGPVKEPTKKEKRNPYIPFETPRATPKPPKRPERWNPNSIFPSRRVPPRKEKDRAKKYGRLDVSKFDKY
jgi:hypothetical protein